MSMPEIPCSAILRRIGDWIDVLVTLVTTQPRELVTAVFRFEDEPTNLTDQMVSVDVKPQRLPMSARNCHSRVTGLR
jgi:hypothetical protein